MLDMVKLASALKKSEAILFADTSEAYGCIAAAWDILKNDPLFSYRVAACMHTSWSLPTWSEDLSTRYALASYNEPYAIVSTDGSQIYPDRHSGTSCALINIGTVVIPYKMGGIGVQLYSEPYLIPPSDANEALSLTDIINIRRQEYEFLHAERAEADIKNMAVLFDGSLIFWHLQSVAGYEAIVGNYCTQLSYFEQNQIPYGSYISDPKAKDLLNLVRLQLCNFNVMREDLYAMVNHCTDATVMHHHLLPGQRSIFFKSTAPITALYPPSQQPYFCYIRHATEIGRLEMPAWLVHNKLLCEQFIAIVWDQLEKGQGYPVCLAEAHEQAVIKGKDRDLFYMLVEQVGLRNKRFITPSQKQQRKNNAFI